MYEAGMASVASVVHEPYHAVSFIDRYIRDKNSISERCKGQDFPDPCCILGQKTALYCESCVNVPRVSLRNLIIGCVSQQAV